MGKDNIILSDNYIAVAKIEKKQENDGFNEVQVVDDSVFKGEVVFLPACPVFVGNHQLSIGEYVAFAKYQPDTHDIEHEGKNLKFINVKSLLFVYE